MKVGDYIRTIYGIAKIKSVIPETDMTFIETDNGIGDFYSTQNGKLRKGVIITEKDINKISSNIIDLIEEGDYVNGKLVIEHAYQKGRLFVTNLYIGGKGFTTCEDYSWELTKENEDYIDSILTKEQFESMEYKVVE